MSDEGTGAGCRVVRNPDVQVFKPSNDFSNRRPNTATNKADSENTEPPIVDTMLMVLDSRKRTPQTTNSALRKYERNKQSEPMANPKNASFHCRLANHKLWSTISDCIFGGSLWVLALAPTSDARSLVDSLHRSSLPSSTPTHPSSL